MAGARRDQRPGESGAGMGSGRGFAVEVEGGVGDLGIWVVFDLSGGVGEVDFLFHELVGPVFANDLDDDGVGAAFDGFAEGVAAVP